MPNYKKKKHSKFFSAPKPKIEKPQKNITPEEEVKMTPAEKYRKTTVKQNMKVVKGKKIEQKRRLRIVCVIAAALLLFYGIFEMILPMGVFEKISHFTSTLGAGSYPIELESTQTVNVINHGSHYYVLTNSQFFSINSSGKILYSYDHGFENPILKTSDTRALLFDQNSNRGYIFTVADLETTIETEKNIITANISDSGAYALVLHSDKYASAVSVFDEDGDKLYEWFSAENTVNNVALSPDGDQLAVSAFTAAGGKYKSVLNVFEFDSAKPLHTKTFDNTLIYGIDSSHSGYFSVITEHALQFVEWSDFETKQYSNEYSLSMVRPDDDGYVAVFNRKNDKTDNCVAVFEKSGELKYQFDYKGIISDITMADGHIYCMGETGIYMLSDKGKVLRHGSCGFGAVRISVVSSDDIAVITDNKIEKIRLE